MRSSAYLRWCWRSCRAGSVSSSLDDTAYDDGTHDDDDEDCDGNPCLSPCRQPSTVVTIITWNTWPKPAANSCVKQKSLTVVCMWAWSMLGQTVNTQHFSTLWNSLMTSPVRNVINVRRNVTCCTVLWQRIREWTMVLHIAIILLDSEDIARALWRYVTR